MAVMGPLKLALRVSAATSLTVIAACAVWVLADVLRGWRVA